MILKTIKERDVVCDLGVCKNAASISIAGEGVSMENELRLCNECTLKLKNILDGYVKKNIKKD